MIANERMSCRLFAFETRPVCRWHYDPERYGLGCLVEPEAARQALSPPLAARAEGAESAWVYRSLSRRDLSSGSGFSPVGVRKHIFSSNQRTVEELTGRDSD